MIECRHCLIKKFFKSLVRIITSVMLTVLLAMIINDFLITRSLVTTISNLRREVNIYTQELTIKYKILLNIVDELSDIVKKYSTKTDNLEKIQKEIIEKLKKAYNNLDVDKLKTANVRIVNILRGWTGSGTHIKINGESYILTCAHLFADKDDLISVVLNDPGSKVFTKVIEADIIKLNKERDLALIKLKREWNYAYLEIADTSPNIKEEVWAIGNPNNRDDVITWGKVIEKGKFYIHSNISIYFGNSGGALVNNKGQIIGVNSAMYYMYWKLPFQKAKKMEISTRSVNLETIKEFLRDVK